MSWRSDGVDRDDVGAAHPHQAHGQVQPQHPAQPRGRQRAVGEDQDGQPDQDDKEGPAGLGEHGHPPQRQRAVADPVGGDRVQAAVVAERPGDDQAEEAPAERVARLPPGHDEAHHAEGGEGPPLRAAGAGVHAQVRQAGERPLGGEQGHYDSAEHQRGGGRGQPEAARWPAAARPGPPPGSPPSYRRRYARNVPGTLPLAARPEGGRDEEQPSRWTGCRARSRRARVARCRGGLLFSYARYVQGSVSVHIDAPAGRVWELVSDVTRIGEFSPETFEAEWLDGADRAAGRGAVPRSCAAQRSGPGVLDDVHGAGRRPRA